MRAPAIDYTAIRIAMVRAVEQATGLDSQHVSMFQPEVSTDQRPSLPYASVYMSTPSQWFGWDVSAISSDDLTIQTLTGPRCITAEFTSYAESHEEAHGIIATLQAALFSESVRASLKAAGVSVWSIEDVTDESKALDTGFEGRAKVVATFGVVSCLRLTSPGTIESATVDDTLDGSVITIEGDSGT
jgi:hypothetical protein